MKYTLIKKIAISLLIISAAVNMLGCSNVNKVSNNTTTAAANNSTNSVNITTDSATNSSSNVAANNTDKSSESSSPANQSSQELLSSILNAAKEGRVINCDFAVKNTNIGNVEDHWGKADSSNWVTAAKGMYFTYSKHAIVFGANKGNQVFEVRSLNNQLSIIHLSEVKVRFGTPQYDVKASGEEIVGYKITDEFKILFVFNEGSANPVLTHYSILYPSGTVNSMAGDKGREW